MIDDYGDFNKIWESNKDYSAGKWRCYFAMLILISFIVLHIPFIHPRQRKLLFLFGIIPISFYKMYYECDNF
jgi:hypothetical protein